MNLPLYIAKRYLFAKKSHGVINIISAISAIGMAIGTAALVIILSVYNGFDDLVRQMRSSLEPDLLVVPAKGKVFHADSTLFATARGIPYVESVSTVLEDNIYINYDGNNRAARAKGVDREYESISPLGGNISEGIFTLHHGDIPMACVGSVLAASMGISPRFLPAMELWYPSRTRQFSMSNPSASLDMVKVWPAGIFSVNDDLDKDLIVIPIETMRQLMGYGDGDISAIEIRLAPGAGSKEMRGVMDALSALTGEGFRVLDRDHQNPTLYRMMRFEKASIWLILIFVIIIIAFNIFGSLTMLIIEKEEDMEILRSLGATGKTVRRIFILEGWMISLLGMAVGLAAGVGIALLQQHFGLVSMPMSWNGAPYPVILKAGDIIITAVAVTVIGYIIALLPVSRKLTPSPRH